MVKACPVSDSEADAYPEAGATDGHTIVLVGIEYRLGVTPCGSMRAVSWASSDGHTWLRSTGWGDAGASAAFSDAKSVWAVPGGWEAIVWTGSDKPTTLWRSPDGTTWQESTDVVIRQPGGSLVPNTGLAAYAGVADAGGTRLLALSNDQDAAIAGIPGGVGALMTSTDGKVWQEVDATFTAGRAGGGIGPIVPPSAGASSWLLVTQIPEHNP